MRVATSLHADCKVPAHLRSCPLSACRCFGDIDVNKDGFVTRDEFKEWCVSLLRCSGLCSTCTCRWPTRAVRCRYSRDPSAVSQRDVSTTPPPLFPGARAASSRLLQSTPSTPSSSYDDAFTSRPSLSGQLFAIADADGDGVLSRAELYNLLQLQLRSVLSVCPSLRPRDGAPMPVEHLAMDGVNEALRLFDVDRDGCLSQNEFRAWMSAAVLSSDSPRWPAVAAAAATSPDRPGVLSGSRSVEEFRRLSCLDRSDVNSLLSQLLGRCDSAGRLSGRAFKTAMLTLVDVKALRYVPARCAVCCVRHSASHTRRSAFSLPVHCRQSARARVIASRASLI